jgi:hypothetical protein
MGAGGTALGTPALFTLTTGVDDRVVCMDEIDEGAGSAALDRARRHNDGVAAHVHQQFDVDELVGEQNLVLVGEFRPQLQRARRRVDLVVPEPIASS